MAMQEIDTNLLIFGPAASGKCDALEKCIEEYGRNNETALLTTKTALLSAAYGFSGITCISWSPENKKINPEWIKKKYDYIIIDGYCENWENLLTAFPETKFIMAVRATTKGDLSNNLKKAFRVIAKCGFIDKETKTKGITSVTIYKGV
jgi:hypothetical protein